MFEGNAAEASGVSSRPDKSNRGELSACVEFGGGLNQAILLGSLGRSGKYFALRSICDISRSKAGGGEVAADFGSAS